MFRLKKSSLDIKIQRFVKRRYENNSVWLRENSPVHREYFKHCCVHCSILIDPWGHVEFYGVVFMF